MGAESRGPSGEGPSEGDIPPSERPFGTRPFGTRPFGTRPFGTRPFGTRPSDPDIGDERPFGTRPFGTRAYGTRPFGTRPFGTRPFGTRPFGTRPFGTREDHGDGRLDPDEWADDIAELFCASSAVIRLGASLVFGDGSVDVPSIEDERGAARYVDRSRTIDPESNTIDVGASRKKPRLEAVRRVLRPSDHELAVQVVVPDDLARAMGETAALAWPLKQDIADDLALSADRAFLRGAGGAEPLGITAHRGVERVATESDLIAALRGMLARACASGSPFRTPGWLLGAETYSALTTALTTQGRAEDGDGRTLDMESLLTYGEDGGGLLFGYPFAITPAAATAPGETSPAEHVYFGCDWHEAWIAVDRRVVTIDISTDARLDTDETVVRATMRHDFVLRRPSAFSHLAAPALEFPLP